MDVTRKCISHILELREILLSFQTGFNFSMLLLYFFMVAHKAACQTLSKALLKSAVRFTRIQEDGCDMGAHQSYLLTERNTRVIPNWFQPYSCHSKLVSTLSMLLLSGLPFIFIFFSPPPPLPHPSLLWTTRSRINDVSLCLCQRKL